MTFGSRAASARERLVRHLAATGAAAPRVLEAIRSVPRERFIPEAMQRWAYEDQALAIGHGQTISQPTIVAIMTAALALQGDERVLEIGTGSGYQAAVLAALAREVITVEIVDDLRERAAALLHELGISNVRVLPAGDTLGAPEYAPYDAIIVTAAAPAVPASLLEQLRPGGRIVAPVGDRAEQQLMLITRTDEGIREQSLGRCRFVPLLGPEGFAPEP